MTAADNEELDALVRELRGIAGVTDVAAIDKAADAITALRARVAELERSERERARLQDLFDRATQPLKLNEYREYITSANRVPVTRCQLSAEHLRQLIDRAEAAEANAERYLWLKAERPDGLCAIAYRYKPATHFDEPDACIDAARMADGKAGGPHGCGQ